MISQPEKVLCSRLTQAGEQVCVWEPELGRRLDAEVCTLAARVVTRCALHTVLCLHTRLCLSPPAGCLAAVGARQSVQGVLLQVAAAVDPCVCESTGAAPAQMVVGGSSAVTDRSDGRVVLAHLSVMTPEVAWALECFV